MKIFYKSNWVHLTIILLISTQSCKLNVNEPLSWETDLLAPIATSNVNISDLVSDSSTITSNTSGFVFLNVSDTIETRNLEDIFTIPDTTIIRNFDLASFQLADTVLEQSITLGQIARSISGGDLLIASHGSILPIVPAQSGVVAGPFSVDASDFFEFAELTSGELDLTIVNELPLAISNLSFSLDNQSSGENIIADQFERVDPDQEISETYDLSGKQIESTINVNIANLDLEGGIGVPIDTNDKIILRLGIRQLAASSAVAIFPSQTVAEVTEPIVYQFTGDNDDVELTFARVASGSLDVEIVSTIEDSIRFTYELVSAKNGNEIPSVVGKILPAIPPNPSIFTQSEDISGFYLDLTFGNTTVNTLTQYYKIDLIFSGKTIRIDDRDRIFALVTLNQIQSSYVQGYFGSDTLNFSGESNISIFDELDLESVALTQPSANLRIINDLGLSASLTISELTGFSSNSNNSLALQGESIGAALDIQRPFLPDTFGQAITLIPFQTSNSNIRDFVNLLPDRLVYDLSLSYNPQGTIISRQDFATDESEISVVLDVQIPLEGSLSGLTLIDTADWDLTETDLDEIQGGTLKIFVENTFPIQAEFTADVRDVNWEPLDTLIQDAIIEPGIIGDNGIVTEPTSSTIEVTLDKDELIKLSELGSKIILQYSLKTHPQNEPVMIFDFYQLSAELVVEITYNLEL